MFVTRKFGEPQDALLFRKDSFPVFSFQVVGDAHFLIWRCFLKPFRHQKDARKMLIKLFLCCKIEFLEKRDIFPDQKNPRNVRFRGKFVILYQKGQKCSKDAFLRALHHIKRCSATRKPGFIQKDAKNLPASWGRGNT